MDHTETLRETRTEFAERYGNFINGKLADPASGKYFKNTSPVNGRVLCEIARSDAQDIEVALDAAHAAGIVHRDIKPANILLSAADGAVKIADFGVARLASSELTSSGTSLGSPAYMSPEQISGSRVDGRSDLFSLAVILYEALCGDKPFDGETVPSIVHSIINETAIEILTLLTVSQKTA